jgi:hypothetical protein
MTTTAHRPWADDLAVDVRRFAALTCRWRQPSLAACARAKSPEKVGSTSRGDRCSSLGIIAFDYCKQLAKCDPAISSILCCVDGMSPSVSRPYMLSCHAIVEY